MPKGGGFEGAAVPQSTAFFRILHHGKVCVCVCRLRKGSMGFFFQLGADPPAEYVRSKMSLSQSERAEHRWKLH